MVIHNEAWYRREKAFVEMSWEKIRAMLGNALRENSEALFRIKDGQGNPVRFQIDQVDPYDRSKDMLVFLANVPGNSTATYYITDEVTGKEEKASDNAKIHSRSPQHWDFILQNGIVELSVHRGRTPFGYLAGSAFSVKLLDGDVEITDPFGMRAPEYARRAMQIERIFTKLPWNPDSETEWYFADCDYEYVNSGGGSLRSFLTLRAPFFIEYENPVRSGPGKVITYLTCFLYRLISLYVGKDYVREDIWVEAEKYRKVFKNAKEELLEEGSMRVPLSFRASFSMSIPGLRGSGVDFRKMHICPDWFAVGNDYPPHPGIGFASNAHVNMVHDPEIGNYFCTWDLTPTWYVRCLHQFMGGRNVTGTGQEHNFGHVVGSNWYDAIYAPLWGEIVSQT